MQKFVYFKRGLKAVDLVYNLKMDVCKEKGMRNWHTHTYLRMHTYVYVCLLFSACKVCHSMLKRLSSLLWNQIIGMRRWGCGKRGHYPPLTIICLAIKSFSINWLKETKSHLSSGKLHIRVMSIQCIGCLRYESYLINSIPICSNNFVYLISMMLFFHCVWTYLSQVTYARKNISNLGQFH